MERNANYALVGLISTVLLIGMIVFVLWLTNFALSAKFDNYDIVFHGPIQGLSKGGDVQFNGIKVGEVSDIRLDRQDPNLVIAIARVSQDTPIRADSAATLEPQGITGVNYIQITAGTTAKRLLKDATPPGKTPTLYAKGSTISQLLSGGGAVMEDAVETLGRINRVLSDQNIEKVTAIISDVQSVTNELNERKAIIADADTALQRAGEAAVQIRDLAKNANGLVSSDGKTTMAKIAGAADQIQGAASEAHTMLSKLEGPTSDFATNGLPQLTATLQRLQEATETLNGLLADVRNNPQGLLNKPAAKQVEVKP